MTSMDFGLSLSLLLSIVGMEGVTLVAADIPPQPANEYGYRHGQMTQAADSKNTQECNMSLNRCPILNFHPQIRDCIAIKRTWDSHEKLDRVSVAVEGKLSVLHRAVRDECGRSQMGRRGVSKHSYDSSRYPVVGINDARCLKKWKITKTWDLRIKILYWGITSTLEALH